LLAGPSLGEALEGAGGLTEHLGVRSGEELKHKTKKKEKRRQMRMQQTELRARVLGVGERTL
jgi:hypothetical protein